MKAWKIANQSLSLQEAATPINDRGQVRVRVEAVGINRADLLQVKGLYPAPPGVVADIPGLEYVGVIDATGEDCVTRRVGERVMGLVPGGAFAEYVVCHEEETLSIPAGMTVEQAATLPESFTTAYRALVSDADLQPGEWCLVRPASAAVGMAAAQLANAMGAQVLGSSRDVRRLSLQHEQGELHECITEPLTLDAIRDATDGNGLDVVIDMVGPDWDSLLPALNNSARIVLLGILGGATTTVPLAHVLMNQLTISAMTLRRQPLTERLRLARQFQRVLLPMFERRQLNALPFHVHPFNRAPDALAAVRSRGDVGKHVLIMS